MPFVPYVIVRTHRDEPLSRHALILWWFLSLVLIGGLLTAVIVTVSN